MRMCRKTGLLDLACLKVGSWVLVKYNGSTSMPTVRGSLKCYVGCISKVNESQDFGKWEVRFLKKSQKTNNTFLDSLSVDQSVDDVDDESIISILPYPVIRRGLHTFKFDFSKYCVE
jgi:hypothetical protein